PPNLYTVCVEVLDHTDAPVTAGRWHTMHRRGAAPAKQGWVRKAKCEAFIFSHRSGLNRVLNINQIWTFGHSFKSNSHQPGEASTTVLRRRWHSVRRIGRKSVSRM